MEDPLDDYLSSIDKRSLKKPKLVLNHIRDAYPIGIPALSIKSTTDRIGLDAGYSFHLGTAEPELRRIASWIFTNISHSEKIENITKIINLKKHQKQIMFISYGWRMELQLFVV